MPVVVSNGSSSRMEDVSLDSHTLHAKKPFQYSWRVGFFFSDASVERLPAEHSWVGLGFTVPLAEGVCVCGVGGGGGSCSHE